MTENLRVVAESGEIPRRLGSKQASGTKGRVPRTHTPVQMSVIGMLRQIDRDSFLLPGYNQHDSLGLEDFGPQFADASFGADSEWQGKCVPVLVGVGCIGVSGCKRTPDTTIVGGDVCAVRADCDPSVGGGVVGDGGAVTVGQSF